MLRAECDRNQKLQKLLLRYALKLFNQVSQTAACNNHHTVKQRTARWLLMLDDRSDEELHMTQQLLSQMLGVRRTGITEVASDLQRQGIIDYRRGKIRILDRPALETIACECYQVLKYQFNA
ncbi:MAG: helix-turn-helix domain-containing protein [Pleurocapsa sp. MO_226.B13]|nr:helix-turn-helix domain-containing protein [Pleurocapsa sp. MO_226.B13]